MKKDINRRRFIRNTAFASLGLSLTGAANSMGIIPYKSSNSTSVRTGEIVHVGIIGLDTSHSLAFTKIINGLGSNFRVVIAYPHGSRDIQANVERIPEAMESMKKIGIEIAGSINELLEKVDVVLLETYDGRLHLEQALLVMKAGKKLFIDKPIAASLADTMAIFEASKQYDVPVFSSSARRFNPGIQEFARGKTVGEIIDVDSFSPCIVQDTHPDLAWYGIHGVEALFTLMGKGCKEVVRVHAANTDIVVGTWEDDRIGTFRGMRGKRAKGHGGHVFGKKSIAPIPPFIGYEYLIMEILDFFRTGNVPVSPEETLEIMAFIEAADESKRQGGAPVSLQAMFCKAKAE